LFSVLPKKNLVLRLLPPRADHDEYDEERRRSRRRREEEASGACEGDD
jgi:hypothetical protein